MDKRSLSERDICTKFSTPALRRGRMDLWARYRTRKGLTPEAEEIVLQDYFNDRV